MMELEGLGGEGVIASMHLRFMLPEKCPVYNSSLRGILPYGSPSDDCASYAKFAKDCKILGEELYSRGINNPVRKTGEWFAAEVESSIFAAVSKE